MVLYHFVTYIREYYFTGEKLYAIRRNRPVIVATGKLTPRRITIFNWRQWRRRHRLSAVTNRQGKYCFTPVSVGLESMSYLLLKN